MLYEENNAAIFLKWSLWVFADKRPRLVGQSPFCLSSNLLDSPDQHCSSPSFASSVHNYMDARYNIRDDTQATDDPQSLSCAWCIQRAHLLKWTYWLLFKTNKGACWVLQ